MQSTQFMTLESDLLVLGSVLRIIKNRAVFVCAFFTISK